MRRNARRLEFEPGLVGRDLQRLRPDQTLAEFLDRLPALPRELVVVPHRHERETRARVLQVRVLQVGVIELAVIVQRLRDAEAVLRDGLAARREFHRERYDAVVAVPVLDLVRVLHDFVDEIAQVQHEAQPVLRRGAFVLEDHPAPGVHRALADVLATDEREARRARVVAPRRRQRAADPAAVAVGVDEAVPVFAGGFQAGHEHAAGPVGPAKDARIRRRDHARECGILRHFDQQSGLLAPIRVGAPRPQQHAVFVRVARCDALRIEIAPFAPAARRFADRRTANRQSRTQRGGEFQEFAAIEVRHVVPHGAARVCARRHANARQARASVPEVGGLPGHEGEGFGSFRWPRSAGGRRSG